MTDGVWDLLVVGGGTAGIVGSRTAAAVGARTLLVERDRTGGDCLWTGCVPSKALLAAGHRAADIRRASALGVHVDVVRIDSAQVLGHVRAAIQAIEPEDSPDTLARHGVVVRQGSLAFVAPGVAHVDGHPVRFRRALLAVGSSPMIPAMPGLAAALGHTVHTTDTFWDLAALPARLVVVGAGATGCELAQACARLGSAVTLLEGGSRILPAEDADAAAVVFAALSADGVRVLTQTRLVGVEDSAVVVEARGLQSHIPDAHVLLAVGRTPRTAGLDLATVGVATDAQGFVVVDDQLRTSAPTMWAAGDVTGRRLLTSVAGQDAGVAAGNAVLGLRRRIDPLTPRVTFTDPEVASVGEPTDAASRAARSGRVVARAHSHLDRAITDGRTEGFTRLAFSRRSRITGACIVGPRAGETLAEVVLAMRAGRSAADIASTTHAYPTYNDGVWFAAVDRLETSVGRWTPLASRLVAARRLKWQTRKSRR